MNSETNKIQISKNIRPFLNDIAERLWSEPSHAAIMIGAGFSKNANSDFPDWNALGDLFFKKLHGRAPDKNNSEDKYLNVLKLANEVEAAFGRSVLNKILRDAIPDNNSKPSDLHTQLLKLPWTDIFTTNYDTLLERARNTITSQRFDIVINKEDLVYSEQPRIIKLHGSFPSERPFIITEEDYRTYPRKFAPFVNTVQQSLLENTLCLIGFSGDDPNFLQWIGWIRDNLGIESPSKIYLIGLLKISEAQKLLLAQRNILLVDLSQCSGIDINNHAKALEVFFNYLQTYKQERNHLEEWPKNIHMHPSHKGDKIKELTNIIKEWEYIRQNYPGWIIPPEDSRETLWIYTQHWINLTIPDDLKNDLDIKFLYELNWRLEKSLYPIPNELVDFYEKTIIKYQQRPLKANQEKTISLKLSLLRWCREEGQFEKWKALSEDISKLHENLTSEHLAFLHYEQCLFALFNLDIPQLKKKIQEWPNNFGIPLWEAKRAGIMLEIGMIDDAEKIIDITLSKVREKLNLTPIKYDYSMVSTESFIMVMSKYIKDINRFPFSQKPATSEEINEIKELFLQEIPNNNENTNIDKKSNNKLWEEFYNSRETESNQNWGVYLNKMRSEHYSQTIKDYRERWSMLKRYKCDPLGEIKLFTHKLDKPPIQRKEKSETHQFDIGKSTITHHGLGWDSEAITAYKFLRFSEETGFPFRAGNMNFSIKSATGAVKRIAHYSSYWALITFVRLGEIKHVDSIFDRKSLLRFKTTHIDSYVDALLFALKRTKNDLTIESGFFKHNFEVLLAHVLPEILSRLCCRVSKKVKSKILEFILTVYASPLKNNYRSIGKLVERYVNSLTIDEVFELVDKFLGLPFPDNVSLVTERDFANPLLLLNSYNITKKVKQINISADNIVKAFELANSHEHKKREWGITSLVCLFSLKLLTEEHSKKLGEILWSQIDNSSKFPSNSGYYKFAFLSLPHPDDVNPVELLKEYINRSSFPAQNGRKDKGISMSGGHIPLCNEIVGSANKVKWEQQEILELFNKLISWWDSDKEYLKQEDQFSLFGGIRSEFKARFRNLINILVEVIFPNLSNGSLSENVLNKTKRLIKEFDEYSIHSIEVKVASVSLFTTDVKVIIDELLKGIKSSKREEVIHAFKGINLLLKSHSDSTDDLLRILSQKMQWRHEPGLVSALNVSSMIIHKNEINYKAGFISACLIGLEYLIFETELSAEIEYDKFAETLLLRLACVKLSTTLYKWHEDNNKPIPQILEKWKEICKSEDEFAEIRVAWINEVRY